MKKIKFFLVALTLFFAASSYAQVSKSDTLKINVGFHCPNGKALIEKELKKLDGISFVAADVATKNVTIIYDATKQNKEKIVTAIETIGYTTEFSKEGAVKKKACSHDTEKHE